MQYVFSECVVDVVLVCIRHGCFNVCVYVLGVCMYVVGVYVLCVYVLYVSIVSVYVAHGYVFCVV